MKTNTPAVNAERTHEAAPARIPKPVAQLERQVATCMLFEDTFYEKGSEIAAGIAASCATVPVQEIADCAVKAREDFKLRHVPLFLLAQLNKRRNEVPGLLAKTVERVIQRPDELAESLAILSKVEGKPVKRVMSHGFENGLARAFRKFSPYQLAKWNRDSAIKLRDVLFLTHAKPKDADQAATWKALVEGTLAAPDTWEVALSAGADKKATWERLLAESRLGYMALLMNLRNMTEAGVDRMLVEASLLNGASGSRALPFRFVSAAKAAPAFAQALSDGMLAAIDTTAKLPGVTYFLLDVSGSMDAALSAKGTLTRLEAAGALGVLLREVAQACRVFTFSLRLEEVANLRGLALVSGMSRSQEHSGTHLAGALATMKAKLPAPDRLVVITDEQSHDGIMALPAGVNGYVVNVAPYRPGLDVSGGWVRINGFSERVVDFIRYHEADAQ